MLRAPGPWYLTGQSGGRVPIWWSLPSSCLLLPVSNVSGSPVRLVGEARPESAPWQIPRALGWGRQSFPAQAPGLLVKGRGQAADGRSVGGGGTDTYTTTPTSPPPPHPPPWVPPSLACTAHCPTAASPDVAEIQPCCAVKHLHVLSRTHTPTHTPGSCPWHLRRQSEPHRSG